MEPPPIFLRKQLKNHLIMANEGLLCQVDGDSHQSVGDIYGASEKRV